MWYAILVIFSVSTGATVFDVYRLPFTEKAICEAALPALQARYTDPFGTMGGCLYIEDTDGI